MTVYYILFALILGLAYPLCVRKPKKAKKIIYLCIVFGYMFFLSACRYGIGNDYFNYRRIFYYLSDGIQSAGDMLKAGMEPGYIFLMKAVLLFSQEYTVFNIVTAVIILVPMAVIIYKYSSSVWISSLMYVCITFFYNSINFTRQSISVAIIFCGYRFFKEKKHLPAILIILAAGMFHYTSLVLLPIYLLSVFIKPSAKSLAVLSFFGMIVVIFSRQIINIVLTYILPIYAQYQDTVYITRGLSKSYLVIPAIFLVLTLAAYFMGWRKSCEEASVMTNFMFYSFFIWIFVVKHFIIERFSMPVYVFALLTIPSVLDYFKYIPQKADELALKKKHLHRKGKQVSSAVQNEKSIYVKLNAMKKALPHNLIAAFAIVSMLLYNNFCVGQGVHGVFPYKSLIQGLTNATDSSIDPTADYKLVFLNNKYYEFLCNVYNNRERYTVIAAVKGYASGNTETIYDNALQMLGAQTRMNDLDGKSCIMAFTNGESFLNITSDELISEEISLYNGKYIVNAVSGGVNCGSTSSLIVNGTEYSTNVEGINFLVFDNYLEKLVDSHGYDLTDRNMTYAYTTVYIM